VTLLAIPNVSEGRAQATIDAIAQAFSSSGARLLDVHTDPDHHRSVFTLAGEPGELAEAVTAGAREALARIDLTKHSGIHPRVGVIDVAPIVYLTEADRGAACAEVLVQADRLGSELGLPVFMYGELARGRTRAEIRRGGPSELDARIRTGAITSDFGPQRLDPQRGAVLVGARPPLVAFNVELADPATEHEAKEIARDIRESGPHGLKGLRAIGLWLAHRQAAQVSMNIEDHRATPLNEVVEAIERHARPTAAELVGLAPRAAFAGFPDDLPVRNRRTIEDALADSL
jgi:glutamate formiminotransferase/glutamate formiminotransferase/formiminotetrahydrofolate cyclodeaminase